MKKIDGWLDGWMVGWMAKKIYEKNKDCWMVQKNEKLMDGWKDKK